LIDLPFNSLFYLLQQTLTICVVEVDTRLSVKLKCLYEGLLCLAYVPFRVLASSLAGLQEWMSEKLLKRQPAIRLEFEAAIQEVNALEAHYHLLGDLVDSDFDVLLELGQVPTEEGVLTGEQLEEECAKGPDVCFLVVLLIADHFRRHVEGSATEGVGELPF